jgi:hypothetical protein
MIFALLTLASLVAPALARTQKELEYAAIRQREAQYEDRLGKSQELAREQFAADQKKN